MRRHSQNQFYPILVTVFLSLAAIIASQTAHAREVIYGKGRETIPVAFGVETLFRFPLEVKTVTEASRFEIHPASGEEPDYSVLVVKPRMNEGAADITFILSDGSAIRTQIVVSNRPNLKKDSIYDFKPAEELPTTNPNISDKHEPLQISELDLMRGMIQGNQVSGFDISHYSQSISLGSKDITAELVKVYAGKDMNGYVYLLRTSSESSKQFEIDLANLAIGQPNLAILAEADATLIGGGIEEKRKTFLRIVAKPGASAHQMILPVALQKDAK